MKSLAFFMLLIILPSSALALEVTNLKFGYLDREMTKVILVSHTNKYRINGVCESAGISSPCMWQGYEFEYNGAADNYTLNCSVALSKKVKIVTSKKLISESTDLHEFDLTLPESKGIFLNPTYTLKDATDTGLFTTTQECSYKGERVFTIKWTVDYGK